MPIPIDAEAARRLAPRFEEALALALNEFDGLDLHEQYRNGFARLLKHDPLGRVLMMGTDQRDLFVPALRGIAAATLRPGGRLHDIGGGDGQTFALVADAVPEGTTVALVEPNPGYVADYRALLRRLPRLREGAMVTGPYDAEASAALMADGPADLVTAIHMAYFLAEPARDLAAMAGHLAPGGALVVIVTDETRGYTGAVLEIYLEMGGDGLDGAAQLAAIRQRQGLLGDEGGEPGLLGHLREALPGARFTMESVLQPSRLYGHTLEDMLAIANISNLSAVDDPLKFRAAAALLAERPERADLRIEDDGPRAGMWSVTQPQYVAVLSRRR